VGAGEGTANSAVENGCEKSKMQILCAVEARRADGPQTLYVEFAKARKLCMCNVEPLMSRRRYNGV
jgi:hypothetical protein